MTAFGIYCRRACLVTVAAILTVCFFVSGCGQRNSKDAKEYFLTIYFTSNYKDRYDEWLRITDRPARANLTREKRAQYYADQYERASARFYRDVRKYVSDDFYEKMLMNREIYAFDKYNNQYGISYRVTAIDFEVYSQSGERTTYNFVIHLIETQDDVDTSGTFKGQIAEEPGENGNVVVNLYFSRLGFIADEALPAR